MKPASTIKLTKRNAAALAKYADLAGVMPEKFLNQFLEDFLVDEFECDNLNAEGYLGEFTFKNRPKAEQLAHGCLSVTRRTSLTRRQV
jgi:hypothetical protein